MEKKMHSSINQDSKTQDGLEKNCIADKEKEKIVNETNATSGDDFDDRSSSPEIDPSRIDLNALWVVRRLKAKGYESYLTGGCVRDLLLGRSPKDFDVATSASPNEVKSVFRNCRLIGRRFLLAHVVFPGGKIIETATFRAKPSDDIKASEDEDLLVDEDNVYGSMEEDAFRRDLTVNGLFYDPVNGKVIDHVGGREDLQKGLIRTIGDPEIRLQEDPVRILRAIRFATRLGFKIEEKTYEAMKKFSTEILRCAPARLQEELLRLLTSGHAKECMMLALDVGALEALIPELLEGLGLQPMTIGQEKVSEPLEKNKQEEILKYWQNMLLALDETHDRDCHIPSVVALTALLMPAYARLEESKLYERNWIDGLCVSWAQRLRMTRRDQDLLRILLSAIPLFSLQKVHQKSAQYLVRKPWFKESLFTYILYLLAKGESLDQVKIWKRIAKEADRPYKQIRRSHRVVQSSFRKRGSNKQR